MWGSASAWQNSMPQLPSDPLMPLFQAQHFPVENRISSCEPWGLATGKGSLKRLEFLSIDWTIGWKRMELTIDWRLMVTYGCLWNVRMWSFDLSFWMRHALRIRPWPPSSDPQCAILSQSFVAQPWLFEAVFFWAPKSSFLGVSSWHGAAMFWNLEIRKSSQLLFTVWLWRVLGKRLCRS